MKRIWQTVLISIIVSIIVTTLGLIVGPKILSTAPSVVNTNGYSMVAGVIRNGGNGWAVINDTGHEPIGIIGVSQDDQRITIEYAKKSRVGALSVTVDEAMASQGYVVGASVGLDKSYIYIYDKDNNPVNPSDYVNSNGNIWIEGIFKN